MEKIRAAFLLLFLALLLLGCVCPPSCDDGDPCTYDHCGPDTGYVCAYDQIQGCSYGSC
ncbi:MAG: hypothetical protein AB1657_04235 [Candidatus Micrarchaeota archaeon]